MKYKTCQFCNQKRRKRGSLGIIKVLLKIEKTVTFASFRMPIVAKNFRNILIKDLVKFAFLNFWAQKGPIP